MPTLSTNARNAAVDGITALLDLGTIEFQTVTSQEVATLTYGNPAFAAATGGTATANSITPDTSATGGTISKAIVKTAGGVQVMQLTCTVTGGGGDVTMNSLVIGAGDTVEITSQTFTQPAS